MRNFIIFLLLSTCSINVFSQEKNKLLFNFDEQYFYFDKIEINYDGSLRFLIPPPHESLFGFVGYSVGIFYGIIPESYYIGIAGDMALGFDWFTLFSGDPSTNKENPQIGASIGGRIYNLLQIKNFRIWSFIGCDFLLIILPMPYAGIELSYKMAGFEYAYYFRINNENPARHRISIKLHLPN